MLKYITTLFCVLTFSSASAGHYLLTNIHGLHIVNGQFQRFSAIEWRDDKIVKLFQTSEPKLQADIKQIDGHGQYLLPGLIDAHGHVLSYGLSLLRVDLSGVKSEQEAVKRVIAYSKSHQAVGWIQGRGWNQVFWQTKQFPSAASLDQAFPNTPVWLKRVDGHAGWANSAAMKLAGIVSNTQSPAGGEIIRDENGQPTGVFVDNAMNLIEQAIKPLNQQQQQKVLLTALNSLAKLGLTSVHDAGIGEITINAYKTLAQQHKLPIRVYAMLDVTDANWLSILKQGRYQSADGMFTLRSVKISADGALGSRGAALLADYTDKPHHRGLLLHSPEQLNNYVKTAMQAGFQVNTHAIGDKANHLVLNTYQKNIALTQSQNQRHRIEHAQVVTLEDLPRFAELGIIASMQATHATSDKNMAEDRIGADRLKGAYAWQTFIKSGAVLANGSDFPVEPPNPFFGLHAAVTRQDRANQPLGGWIPEQKLTREQALASFTINAAFAAHQEHELGNLQPGKKADFILLNKDFSNQNEQTIWQNKVYKTFVNGEMVSH